MGKEMCKNGRMKRKKEEKRENVLQGARKSICSCKRNRDCQGKNGGAPDQAKRLREPWAPPTLRLAVLPRSPSPPWIPVIAVAVTVDMRTGLPGDGPMPVQTACAPATPFIALAVLAQAADACAGSNNTINRVLNSIMLALCEEAANTLRGSRRPWILRHHGRCIPP